MKEVEARELLMILRMREEIGNGEEEEDGVRRKTKVEGRKAEEMWELQGETAMGLGDRPLPWVVTCRSSISLRVKQR